MGFGAAAVVFAIMWHGTSGGWSVGWLIVAFCCLVISVGREV